MTPQELQLELIRHTDRMACGADRVVDDLNKHRDLWRAALMDQPVLNLQSAGLVIDLAKLRGLGEGVWNVEYLYILSSGKDDRKLAAIVKCWKPDEFGWLAPRLAEERTGERGARILYAWWD
jgi:hypothetical protein